MIKITKTLNRADGGNVTANSILDFSTRKLESERIMIYDLKLFFNQICKNENKPQIEGITDFANRIIKECTVEEWAKLNDAGSVDLVQVWLKQLIDIEIGLGFTEII